MKKLIDLSRPEYSARDRESVWAAYYFHLLPVYHRIQAQADRRTWLENVATGEFLSMLEDCSPDELQQLLVEWARHGTVGFEEADLDDLEVYVASLLVGVGEDEKTTAEQLNAWAKIGEEARINRNRS